MVRSCSRRRWNPGLPDASAASHCLIASTVRPLRWLMRRGSLRVTVLGEDRARRRYAVHLVAVRGPLPLHRLAKSDLCRHQRAKARLHQSTRIVLADAIEGSLRVARELFDRDAKLLKIRSLVDTRKRIRDGGGHGGLLALGAVSPLRYHYPSYAQDLYPTPNFGAPSGLCVSTWAP